MKGLTLTFVCALLFLTPIVICHSFNNPFVEAKQIFVGFVITFLFVVWLIGSHFKKNFLLPGDKAAKVFGGFILWQLVTFLWSASLHLSLRAWALQLAFFFFYCIVVTNIRSTRLRLFLLFCPVLAASLVSALALLQYYELDVHILPHLRVRGLFNMGVLIMLKRAETNVKIYSFLGHRNYVAGYLMACVPLLVTLFIVWFQRFVTEKRTLGKVLLLLFLAITKIMTLATIVLTHTRGSWVGLAAGLFVYLLCVCKALGRKEVRNLFFVIFVLIVIFMALVALFPKANRMKQSTVSRLRSTLNLRSGSVNERRLLLKTAWRMITSDWKIFFFGKGMGTYPIHHVPFQSKIIHEDGGKQFWPVVNKTWWVHNEVLNFWAETGLVGLLFIALFLYHLFGPPLRELCQSERPLFEVLLLVGGISSLVAILVHNLFTFSLHLPSSGLLFYGLAALLVGSLQEPVSRPVPGPARHLLLLVGILAALMVMNLLFSAMRAQMLWQRAFTVATDGDQLKAIQLVQKAIRLDPGNLDLVFDYGRLLQDSGRWEESRKVYFSIKDIFIDASIEQNIANTYRAQGKMKKAFEHYEKALHHSPAHPTALYWYCRSLIDQRQWRKAYELLQRGVYYRPYNADIAFLCGLSAFALHKDDEAEKHFKQVLQLKPKNERAQALKNLIPALRKSSDGGFSLIKKIWSARPNDWFIRILAERVGVVESRSYQR